MALTRSRDEIDFINKMAGRTAIQKRHDTMSRKLICLMCFVSMALAGHVQAVDFVDTGDTLWSTAGNWSTGKVPIAADWAKISNASSLHQTAMINSGVNAVSLKTHVGYTGGGTLTINGGTLGTVGDDLLLGKNGGSGTLNLISGTLTVGKDLEVGGGDPGTINMTGGAINVARDFMIPLSAGSAAEVHLEGGMITVNGALTMGATGSMDISGGTLIVDGNVTNTINGYITSGWITAYDGAGTLTVDTTANPGQTTVTAFLPSVPPTETTGPAPLSGSTGVSISSTLSWTSGFNVSSHDVYFGTDPTPDSPEFIVNQTGTTFDPGTLHLNTTYYWRIDEKNAIGTATGNVWSFTTSAEPPTKATEPTPSSGATDERINPVLSWSSVLSASSHDVYFGTDPTPDNDEFQGNQTDNTFRPGALRLNTTYYWRIDEKNSFGTTPGDVWSFTTRITAPSVVVIVPTGTSDDTDLIQAALDGLQEGDTLQLNGHFVHKETLYLVSDFTWILNGTLTLAPNSSRNLDKVGLKYPGFNNSRSTAIGTREGAKNIDMSGGIIYGNGDLNGEATGLPRVRQLNCVFAENSYFHDMVVEDASDDCFTLGAASHHNRAERIMGRHAGGKIEKIGGNALTDVGHHNTWVDCIADQGGSDGWTPKCKYSTFIRCIAANNDGPGWGMYAREEGYDGNEDVGAHIIGNRFIDCVAYGSKASSGFAFDISSNCPGGIIRDNFIQAVCYDNHKSGVNFRNKDDAETGIIENNEVDLVCYGNLGLNSSGDFNTWAGGLGMENDNSSLHNTIENITGSVVCFDNRIDVNTRGGHYCNITVYRPEGENYPVLDDKNNNTVTVIGLNSLDPLEPWRMQAYYDLLTEYNLIQNGSFETGNSFNWEVGSPAEVTVSNNKASDGSWALKLESSDGTIAATSQIVSVEPNTDYIFTHSVNYSAGSSGTVTARLTFDGNTLNVSTRSSTDGWKTKRTGFNSGSATEVQIDIYADGAFNGPAYVDDLSLAVPEQAFQYNRWATDQGAGSADADDDGDGLDNLYEYALDGNPGSALVPLIPVSIQTTNRFEYSHHQRNDDLSLVYTVEFCTNLVNGAWTDARMVTVTNGSAGMYDDVTHTIPIEGQAFLRLTVETQTSTNYVNDGYYE